MLDGQSKFHREDILGRRTPRWFMVHHGVSGKQSPGVPPAYRVKISLLLAPIVAIVGKVGMPGPLWTRAVGASDRATPFRPHCQTCLDTFCHVTY